MSSNLLRVASVTVTFNPDPSRLARQLAALRGEVDDMLVVDNGSATSLGSQLPPQALPGLVELGENRGVAAGFNVGIEEARRRGARFVLLLDHDSVPAPGMVAALVEGHGRATAIAGREVAAVGPRVCDARDRRELPFVRFGWTHNRHVRCASDADGPIACDFLISSGCLLALDCFERVGPLDEGLFIDSVDLEWCCRARSRGFALYGICSARLEHALGDERRTVLPGVSLVVHSPERLYYMTRNRLRLYGRGYVPLKWKLKDALRALSKVAATLAFLSPRAAYARMTAHAVADALAGRAGKRREASGSERAS